MPTTLKSVTINKQSLSILGLLGAVLVVLKVIGMSELSWLWTLAPFWLGPAILFSVVGAVVGVVALVGIVAGLVTLTSGAWDNHKRKKLLKERRGTS